MTPPDPPHHVVADGDVGFVDGGDADLEDVVESVLPLAGRLASGGVITVRTLREDVVAGLLAWGAGTDAPVDAIASFPQPPGLIVTLRCR